MLATNIEQQIKEIIEKKGNAGWIRVQECAMEYALLAKDRPWIRETIESRKTKFYGWRRKVGRNHVEGFKVLLLPGNVSYIGLGSADPKVIADLISEDKKTSRNVSTNLGFFDYLRWRKEHNELKRDADLRRHRYNIEVIKEKMLLDENDPEYSSKVEKIEQDRLKKYGLDHP